MNFHKPPKSPSGGLAKLKKCLSALTLLGVVGVGSTSAFAAAVPAEEAPDFEPIASLKSLKVPEPSNYYEFVKNKDAAIALGKALFWEMRAGSDGEKACATCHFAAGVDNRLKNQLAPAKNFDAFHSRKPNDTLKLADFPFVKFDDVLKNDKSDSDFNSGTLLRDVRDVAGSSGVFLEQFLGVTPGATADETELLPNPLFTVAGLQVYQVTDRNAPTVINSIFNLRNFWDGRAQTIFNGVNPFGKRDPSAGIYVNENGNPVKRAVTINDSSIASLAVGPVLSTIEMSAIGRNLPQVGKRMIPMRMLEGQQVAYDDSVLGQYVGPNGDGLVYTYEQAIQYVFNDRLWNANKTVFIEGEEFTQMQANFSLFWGLAIQSYVATLVSDDTPFDRYMEGDSNALTSAQVEGMKVFLDKGKCVNCHDGAAFTGAAIKRDSLQGKTSRIERMIMGNKEEAIYDAGFYNIGVTRTEDDLGVGDVDPFGNPLSFSRLAKKGVSEFYFKELDSPNENVQSNDRTAVDGAFKTPTLRNIALTAPYFHNGGYGTLRQVVEFYNRGGNFPHNNRNDLDADIERLELSNEEMDNLVEFLLALTDDRVKNHAAPFDHPMIEIADGFTGDADGNGIEEDPDLPGAAADIGLEIPAVGKNGYANPVEAVPTFTERIGGDHFVDSEGKTREQRAEEEVTPLPLPSELYKAGKLVKCAYENNTCDLGRAAKPAIVYYADNIFDLSKDRSYAGLTDIDAASIECSNAVFGDPKQGQRKACYYVKP